MTAVASPYLVPFDGNFALASAPSAPPSDANAQVGKGKKKKDKKAKRDQKKKKHKGGPLADLEKQWEGQLEEHVDALRDLQKLLYADNQHALLLVFQAMDAAGKDSTIRKVLSGVNPAGFQVSSFKAPSSQERDHDFLWRTAKALPERGRIGVFNRSYYEEVLVVRVHPKFLAGQQLPENCRGENVWSQRFESIRNHEKHLALNGTTVIKFFLNVSRREQHARFRRRIDDPTNNYKFSAGDLRESALWDQYMAAYQDALNNTSVEAAPWYAIPADNKPFMRMAVADIVRRTLEALPLRYPEPSGDDRAEMMKLRETLID